LVLIYLDFNCFQRGFDDPSQFRIEMEALACQEIFARAEMGKVRLVWSFMHLDEVTLCPFPERRHAVVRLADLCPARVGPHNEIYELAKSLQERAGFSSKDSIHLACAIDAKADAFITCDDRLIKRAKRNAIDEIVIMNPVDYIR
jgi:predicted nucleic acid-binding protein